MKLTFLRNAPLVATLVASLSFGASLSSIAQPKDVTIGLAVANLQADFFNQIKQSVEAEAKAKGVTVITVDAKGDSGRVRRKDYQRKRQNWYPSGATGNNP